MRYHARNLTSYACLIAFALSCAVATSAVAGEPQPGDVVTRSNAEVVKDYVSPGVAWAVENGMDLSIVPYKAIQTAADYLAATEKYASQVTIGPKNELQNWVAGRPFPDVDANDPKAGLKLMYNFENTPYFTDDLNVHLPDADTGAFQVDASNNRVYTVERHFIADWSRRLRHEGRLKHEPTPAFPDSDVFSKQGFYPLIEPFDLKGVGSISFRYKDASRMDDTWLYVPTIRRVRRMSSAQRSDALFGQDIDLDSFGGYAGQVPWFEWRLIGEKPMLGSFHGKNLPPKVCTRDGGMTYCEDWEMRPSVYVIEGKPKVPDYAYSKRVIYLDKEAYIIPYSDLYDRNGELWKVVIQNIRTSTQPNPNIDFSYPEERMFVYAFTVVDMQLLHGTRAAIPGMQFPDEPGWFIDIGFDHKYSVEDDWYTIAGLISGGR